MGLVVGKPFKRSRAGVRVQLSVPERSLIARLLDDVESLLAEGSVDPDAAEPGPTESGPTGPADGDVLAALAASWTAPAAVPADPALARLLPDGNRDDPELAGSYRRLTEHGLRARKRAGLELASAALTRDEPVLLTSAEALALLKGMTDIRLVLAERLGVRTDEDAQALHEHLGRGDDLSDPTAAAAALYDALTWWQEALIVALR